MSDASSQSRAEEFRTRLNADIEHHENLRRWDSGLHQFLIIGAAIAGFISLCLGLFASKDSRFGIAAGCVGALTSVATILSQQLHCVKAINWHSRMAVYLDAIRSRFLDEYRSDPKDEKLAELSREVSKVKIEMQGAWEIVTSREPIALGKLDEK